jgi:Rho-binding antiterminator
VLRKIPLMLKYRVASGVVTARLLPLDVATRAGAEWLRVQSENGSVSEIRLDSIVAFEESPRHPT